MNTLIQINLFACLTWLTILTQLICAAHAQSLVRTNSIKMDHQFINFLDGSTETNKQCESNLPALEEEVFLLQNPFWLEVPQQHETNISQEFYCKCVGKALFTQNIEAIEILPLKNCKVDQPMNAALDMGFT